MFGRRLQTRCQLTIAFMLFGLLMFFFIWRWRIYDTISFSHFHYQYSSVLPYLIKTINLTYTHPVGDLPSSDYRRLMNLKSFKFHMVNGCTSSLVLLVAIHSAPENFNRRKCIRETWGQNREDLKVVFLLGDVEDLNLQRRLEEENKSQGDFVQGNFLDAYKNLTYKHVMAFKYAIYHCPQAKYILKTDDDVFVNMPTMMDFLNLSPSGARHLLLCTPLVNSPAIRDFGSKWRVSYKEFEDEYYPPYCSGWALLYSPEVLFSLYRGAQKSRYFWIDDVLITGILAKDENIQHTSAQSLVLPHQVMEEVATQGGSYNSSKIFLYGPLNLSVDKMYLLWEFVKNRTTSKAVLKDHRYLLEKNYG